MEFDVMTRATTWDNVASLARRVEQAGFSGMLFTEGHQVPWMNIAAASLAAPSLHFSTGIAIAFARSPMVSAEIAWELAQNTRGKFRLGLGSQVKAHIERRFGMPWSAPAPRMRDYIGAMRAVWDCWQTGEPLRFESEMALLLCTLLASHAIGAVIQNNSMKARQPDQNETSSRFSPLNRHRESAP